MRKEELVCSTQSAKKLKELGINSTYNYCWVALNDKFVLFEKHENGNFRSLSYDFTTTHNLFSACYPAFTAAELLRMNPLFKSFSTKMYGDFTIGYWINYLENAFTEHLKVDFTEGLALILIHCLENNLISFDICNEKIK